MHKLVDLAVVGTGDMGQRHLEAIAEAPTTQAIAVVDIDPAGARAANDWDVPYYAAMEPMLDEIKPDGVIVATPNASHVPIALLCVQSDIPVLVEKPISDTLDAALALAVASETAEVPVLVGHHRRHSPIIQRAREVVQSGELGDVTTVSATWTAYKPTNYFETAWRRESGGGPILINLIHDIDCLRFIVGDIAAVQSMTSHERRGFEVEDTAAVLLRFHDGALATIMLSDSVAAPWSWELTSGERTSYDFPQTGQDCYFIGGSKASLAVPSLQTWRYEEAPNWWNPLSKASLAVEEADPIGRQITHFSDVIQGYTEPMITARDAARTLEATLAIIESAATSREVRMRV
jgi:predicted dehydrogenase